MKRVVPWLVKQMNCSPDRGLPWEETTRLRVMHALSSPLDGLDGPMVFPARNRNANAVPNA